MTNCPTEDVLLDYIARTLSPAQTALFESHANKCSRCGALAAAQAAVWRSLDEWKPAPVSAGFNRELWRRIDADTPTSSWSWSGMWKQLTPLAVAMALIATAFVFDHQSRGPVVAPAVVVTAGEADQLEKTLDDIQLLNAVDVAPVKPGSSVM